MFSGNVTCLIVVSAKAYFPILSNASGNDIILSLVHANAYAPIVVMLSGSVIVSISLE